MIQNQYQIPVLHPPAILSVPNNAVSIVTGFYLGTYPLAGFPVSPNVLAELLATKGVERFMETMASINQLAPLLKRIDSFEDAIPAKSQNGELARSDYQRFANEFKREFASHIETLIKHDTPAEALSLSARFADKALQRSVAQKQIAESLNELLSPTGDTPEVYLDYLRLLCKYSVSLLGLPAQKRKKNRPAHVWLSDIVKYKLKYLRHLLRSGVDTRLVERIATNEEITCVSHFSKCPAWQLEPALNLLESTARYSCPRYKIIFRLLQRWDKETGTEVAEKLAAAAKLLEHKRNSSFVHSILFYLDDTKCDSEFVRSLSSLFERMAIRHNKFDQIDRTGDHRHACATLWFFWRTCDRSKFAEFANLILDHETWYAKPLQSFARTMGDRHRMIRLCTLLAKDAPSAAQRLLKSVHRTSSNNSALFYADLALPALKQMEALFDTFVWGLENERDSTLETILRLTSGIRHMKIPASRFLDPPPSTTPSGSETESKDKTGWSDFIGLDPRLDAVIYTCRTLSHSSGAPMEAPGSIKSLFAQREKHRKELDYLQNHLPKISCHLKQNSVVKRVENLKERINKEHHYTEAAVRKAIRILSPLTHKLRLQKLRSIAGAEYCRKLGFNGEHLAPPEIVDAAFLYGQILAEDVDYDLVGEEQNASLLKKMLNAIASGVPDDVRKELNGNKTFVSELQKRNIDAEKWLNPFGRTYTSELFQGGTVHIYSEANPLEILQMGTRFNTCLSKFGSYFSEVVANAVDFNKKVLYAKDGAGNIVGRKMIALSHDFKLVGFPVYSLEKPEQAVQLKELFMNYCAEFAHFSSLALADNGIVKSLHGCRYYVDDCVPWTKDAERMET